MVKVARKRLTGLEEHKVFGCLEEIIAESGSAELSGDEVYQKVCDKLDFIPPLNAVESRMRSLNFVPAKKMLQRSHAKMLGEVVGLALTRMAKETPHHVAIDPIAAKLIAGDIEGAYADRGPLVF